MHALCMCKWARMVCGSYILLYKTFQNAYGSKENENVAYGEFRTMNRMTFLNPAFSAE